MDLHRAARIMALAKGGQILVSSAFAAAVDEELPGEVRLDSLGFFNLRGIEGEDEIFEVRTA